jgi:hypothetical protein
VRIGAVATLIALAAGCDKQSAPEAGAPVLGGGGAATASSSVPVVMPQPPLVFPGDGPLRWGTKAQDLQAALPSTGLEAEGRVQYLACVEPPCPIELRVKAGVREGALGFDLDHRLRELRLQLYGAAAKEQGLAAVERAKARLGAPNHHNESHQGSAASFTFVTSRSDEKAWEVREVYRDAVGKGRGPRPVGATRCSGLDWTQAPAAARRACEGEGWSFVEQQRFVPGRLAIELRRQEWALTIEYVGRSMTGVHFVANSPDKAWVDAQRRASEAALGVVFDMRRFESWEWSSGPTRVYVELRGGEQSPNGWGSNEVYRSGQAL